MKSRALKTTFLLAADIGGTHSRFALFAVSPAQNALPPELTPVKEQWFATAEHGSFAELLGRLVPAGAPRFAPPGTVCAVFGVAGPVSDGLCRPPNIPWEIRENEAVAVLGVKSVLINDFVAQGHACLLSLLDARTRVALEIMELYPADAPSPPKFSAPVALVGAGSGCGKALVLPKMRTVLPSEGGHNELPFLEEEEELASFLRRKYGLVTIDTTASGRGLAGIFAFHCGESLSPAEAGVRLNPPRTPSEKKTLEDFARLYARVCRNYVLDTLALGGLYITGGMALRVPVLEHPAFIGSFRAGGAMGRLLRAVPVFHMRSEQAGLRGAAVYGLLCAETS